MSLAILTPLYNPTNYQLSRLIISYRQLSPLNPTFYIALCSRSDNINSIKDALKSVRNVQICIADDNGPTHALSLIFPKISEDYFMILTCGELLEIVSPHDILFHISNNIDLIYGETNFINSNKTSKVGKIKFNYSYKLRIPLLNLNCCLIRKEIFSKINPFKTDYNFASDYEFILILFSYNPSITFVPSLKLDYFVDGRSEQNKFLAFIEMYLISKKFYPDLFILRATYYFFYTIRHGISPLKFFYRLIKSNK